LGIGPGGLNYLRTWLSEILNLRNMFKRLRICESENLTKERERETSRRSFEEKNVRRLRMLENIHVGTIAVFEIKAEEKSVSENSVFRITLFKK
jgi:hypothetical protein